MDIIFVLLILLAIIGFYFSLTYVNRGILRKVILYKLEKALPDFLNIIRRVIIKRELAPTPVSPEKTSLLEMIREEISLPEPRVIRGFDLNPANIVRLMEVSVPPEDLKRFYARLINWLALNVGVDITRNILGIAEHHVFEHAREGNIRSLNIKVRLLEYYIENHPRILLGVAADILPSVIHKLLNAYISRKLPKELQVMERLRTLRILSIAHVEMEPTLGPILRSMVGVTNFMRTLYKNPASVAELFIIAKYASGIITPENTQVIIRKDKIKENDALLLIEVQVPVNMAVIRELCRSLIRYMNKIEAEPREILIEALKKVFLL